MSAPFNPDAPPDPRTRVKMSQQLWSTQVGMAEAQEGQVNRSAPETAYEFTNGRKFRGKTDPYGPAEPR